MTARPAEKLVEELRERALQLGFSAFGIATQTRESMMSVRLEDALAQGFHGDMEWMAETADRRKAPANLWQDTRSIIMLGMNYGPNEDPMALLAEKSKGSISVYARNRDYHDIIKGKLKELAGLLSRRSGAEVKVFVDTAPVMEKPIAQMAGLGWQGKHTVLVSREHGSWLFLGAIFTSASLPASKPHRESCGSCTRCLDVCPTKAFPAPFQLDARKCLAYLNIEAKGQIPRAYRAPMGNRIYGCDDCLAVCPWNKFASETKEAKLQSREDLKAPDLGALSSLDDAGFRKLFSGSPVKRIGHGRFLRNVLIAIGNSANPELFPKALAWLEAEDTLIRGAAIWAVRRLGDAQDIDRLKAEHARSESNPEVRGEWEGELTPPLDTSI